MFRFAILILAGIGLGALIFGGGPAAGTGVWFLAAIPLFFLLKIMLIATFFGVFARRRFRDHMKEEGWEHPWARRGASWQRPPRRRRQSEQKKPNETDRFDEWHRMAHAKEEVDSWIDKPEDDSSGTM